MTREPLRLIIGNADGENQAPQVSHYKVTQYQRSQQCSCRLLWRSKPSDIAILPCYPDPQIVDYWCEVHRLSDRSRFPKIIVPPFHALHDKYFLRRSRLLQPAFIESVRSVIKGAASSIDEALFYYRDGTAEIFCDLIGIDSVSKFHLSNGAALFNSKAFFRASIQGLGVRAPSGYVCGGPEEAEAVARRLISNGADLMIKADVQSGGWGNTMVSQPGSTQTMRGASKALDVDAAVMGRFWREEVSYPVVIEEYIESRAVFFAEYDVSSASEVSLRSHGSTIMDPLEKGLEIPARYPTEHHHSFLRQSRRIVEFAQSFGYRGVINTNGMLCDETVYINEFNGRCGGPTHMYDMMTCLFPDQPFPAGCVRSGTLVLAPEMTHRILAILREQGLLLCHGMSAGVAPVVIDGEGRLLEYLAVGRGWAEVDAVCSRLLIACETE